MRIAGKWLRAISQSVMHSSLRRGLTLTTLPPRTQTGVSAAWVSIGFKCVRVFVTSVGTLDLHRVCLVVCACLWVQRSCGASVDIVFLCSTCAHRKMSISNGIFAEGSLYTDKGARIVILVLQWHGPECNVQTSSSKNPQRPLQGCPPK